MTSTSQISPFKRTKPPFMFEKKDKETKFMFYWENQPSVLSWEFFQTQTWGWRQQIQLLPPAACTQIGLSQYVPGGEEESHKDILLKSNQSINQYNNSHILSEQLLMSLRQNWCVFSWAALVAWGPCAFAESLHAYACRQYTAAAQWYQIPKSWPKKTLTWL